MNIEDIFEVMKNSTIVEVTTKDVWRDQNFEYFIRKAPLEQSAMGRALFGYEIGKIKQLSKQQFETFVEHKNDYE